MKIKGVLTIYNSARDYYGNCYWAVSLHSLAKKPNKRAILAGRISCDNVSTLDAREGLGWYIERRELPKREFARMVKDWPYIGCGWDEIRAKLTGTKPPKPGALSAVQS